MFNWKVFTIAALAYFAMAPTIAKASDQMVFKMILELPLEDTLTIDLNVIVKECSDIIAASEKQEPGALSKALRYRADAYRRLKKLEAAYKDADQLCKLEPNNPDARFFRVLLLAEMHKADEALKEA